MTILGKLKNSNHDINGKSMQEKIYLDNLRSRMIRCSKYSGGGEGAIKTNVCREFVKVVQLVSF